MTKRLSFLHRTMLAGMSAVVCCTYVNANEKPISTVSQEFEQGFQSVSETVDELPHLAVRLNFAEFLQDLKQQPLVSTHVLSTIVEEIADLTPVDRCQKIAMAELQHRVRLITERNRLKAQLLPTSQYQGRFEALPSGGDWYLHWLQSWLLTDVSVETLKQMATQELLLAHELYVEAQSSAEKAFQLGEYSAEQHGAIVSAFRARETTIKDHLSDAFALDIEIPNVNINPSGLPESFPAPGIYNNQTSTFLYHLQRGVIKEKQMDWLFLHEAFPGHHYQFTLSRQIPFCERDPDAPSHLVSAEGWAAYIETIGSELGMFSHPESAAYAYEWRVLRALRVLIDVGLHHDKWTDDQARALWLGYLPHIPDIMEREITRIRNWPVQVITYVYGKYLIEQAIAEQLSRASAANKQQGLPAVRRAILRLSNQPPIALQYLSGFLNNNNASEGENGHAD